MSTNHDFYVGMTLIGCSTREVKAEALAISEGLEACVSECAIPMREQARAASLGLSKIDVTHTVTPNVSQGMVILAVTASAQLK
jgi:hypothetical protein